MSVNFLSFFLSLAALLATVGGAQAAGKIDVRGDQAEYSADGRRAEFGGNVVIRAAEAIIYAERLIVSVYADGNHYLASGNPARAMCVACAQTPISLSAARISLLDDDKIYIIGGGLTLCAGEASCARGKLQADTAEWHRTNGKVSLRGAPITGYWRAQKDDAPFMIRARQVDYDTASGDVVMRGDAFLAREGDEIRGEKVVFNVNTGALAAEGGDDGGGRVRGVFGTDE